MKHPIAAVIVMLLASTCLHAEVLFHEDFESDQPRLLRMTHTNGDPADIQVHHAGVTDEHAANGKRSFKIDITVNSGDDVHFTLPIDFPFTQTQDLKVQGNLRAENCTISLGFYYRIPAARLSDLVQRGKEQDDLPGKWRSFLAHEPRLHKSVFPTSMHILAVYMRPLPGTQPSRFIKDRVVVYVDDLKVTAIPRQPDRPADYTPEISEGYKIYPVKAMTDEKILPSAPLIPDGMKLDALQITAAQDEYESASFAILAAKELQDVKVTLPPFIKGGDTITSVDMWGVKCWYQPHLDNDQFGPIVPTLTAELLLHDDELVTVDVKSIKQYVRATTTAGEEKYFDIIGPCPQLKRDYRIEDAPTLLPLIIRKYEPKQFWLTVRVPPNTPPGDYKSTIRIQPKNAPAQSLPVTLKVLPYQLPEPCLEYSIYYTAGLKSDDVPLISSDFKTKKQLVAEFRDMKAHGVINPNVRDMENLHAYLKIRNAVGMSQERLFMLHSPHSSTNEQLRRKLTQFKELGFKEVYLVGMDEATGDRLAGQRRHWERAHALGFKMFVACYTDYYPLMGDILDAPVLAGPPKTELAAKITAKGFRVYMYANPQMGQPNPETYRRNFGLGLWKGGYTGAMNYAYQHSLTQHAWNDMALGIADKVAYPTSNGVVVTMAWEGFREGIDDVRYVTLLQNLLDKASKLPEIREKAATIQQWLDNLDPQGDLDMVRDQLRQRITTLRRELG